MSQICTDIVVIGCTALGLLALIITYLPIIGDFYGKFFLFNFVARGLKSCRQRSSQVTNLHMQNLKGKQTCI